MSVLGFFAVAAIWLVWGFLLAHEPSDPPFGPARLASKDLTASKT